MKLYLVQEKHILHPEKYLCFGLKALNELISLCPCGVNKLSTIESAEFSKSKYPADKYSYFTCDTNDHNYLTNVRKILNNK